ncbi:MAG: DUF2169 domain-containing protein [Deltaproteobacteria bacterium]|nr:DUF2169 domain-containing protein [Deltaproteobacteria bacterium]MBW1928440.1 DUF2169 domain-containing protein [Deltaproteobacteria bacterium]
MVKATYEITEQGLELALDDPWPIHLEDLKTPYGVFPAEQCWRKPKIDLIVLGKAKAPGNKPVQQMKVHVRAGDFSYSLAVFGDRWWSEQGGRLIPTEPEPFMEMPLTLERAFGGKYENEYGEIACLNNPEGRGFYADEKSAVGQPLPNLEDPDFLIQEPMDRPKPVGLGPYPLTGGLRFSILAEEEQQPPPFEKIEHLIMNWAHPDLMLDRLAPGEILRVEGITQNGVLEAVIPHFPARAILRFGEEERELTPAMDTVIVLGEEKRLVLRWRLAEVFSMRPREIRKVILSGKKGDKNSS